MDRWEAQYSFWSSFGVPAYEETSVPDRDDIAFPYLTYSAVAAPFNGDVLANASIWTRSNSWLQADTISDLIEAALKNGGRVVNYNGGMLWITAEAPFAQSMGDPEDDKIKRKLLSVAVHFA